MPTGRVTWQGKPGEAWTNDGDRFKYQLICDLVHTCGVCLQYHLAISNWWPIPFHRNCRCSQVPIRPGQSARPFESFREVLRDLDPAQQTEAIGRSNYQLLEAGVVRWEDIVTETRVRSLKEVVAARKLSIGAMEQAGVSKRFATEAFAAVHTPEQVLIRQHRKELVERIEAAGFSKEQIARGVAGEIHRKVSIGAGPSKAQAMPGLKLPPDLKGAFRRFGTGGQSPPQAPRPKAAPSAPKPAEKVDPLRAYREWKPAEKIGQARAWLEEKLGVKEVMGQLPQSAEIAGWKAVEFGEPKAILDHLNTIIGEWNDLVVRYPGLPRDSTQVLFALDGQTGQASLPMKAGGKQALLVKGREWDDDSWEKVRRWEEREGRRLSSERKGSQVVDNFRHELGHNLTTQELHDEFLAAAREHWGDGYLSRARKEVTDYAGTNIREAIAETFGIYTRRDYNEGDLPAWAEGFWRARLGR